MCCYTTLQNLNMQYIHVLKTIPSFSHNFCSQMAVVCNKILSKEHLFIIYIFFAYNDVICYVYSFVYCQILHKMPFSIEESTR